MGQLWGWVRWVVLVGVIAWALLKGGWDRAFQPRVEREGRDGQREWELVEGRRVPSGHNDGDSVAVSVGGRTWIFRLYFVDTLETNPRAEERLERQAAAFGIPPGHAGLARARELARQAKEFTANQTLGAVRIWTRWERVAPGGENPSIRGFIEGRDGDLGLALVREGLGIIKSGSARSPHPDGRTAAEVLRDLRTAEAEARRARRGGWER